MREILFRGKTELLDGSRAWAYGHLVASPYTGTACIYRFAGREAITGNHLTDVRVVNPNTVGQYTGLQDKNGVKIFEGDIVICENYHGKVAGDIKYHLGTFYLACTRYSDEYLFNCDEIEVIGNIYDNPELLEVTP